MRPTNFDEAPRIEFGRWSSISRLSWAVLASILGGLGVDFVPLGVHLGSNLAPKNAPEPPKSAQKPPKTGQELSKSRPRRPGAAQDPPRTRPGGPRQPKSLPRADQDAQEQPRTRFWSVLGWILGPWTAPRHSQDAQHRSKIDQNSIPRCKN